jgi:uncharacterized membrane protein
MDLEVILLRLVHIFAGVFWVGGGALFFLYVEPAVRATAPESAKFMQHLMARGKYSLAMTIASGLTILAGAWLYWRDTAGFTSNWIASRPGIGFTIGAVIGILTFIFGILVMKRNADRLAALGKEIQAAGGPPKPEQLTELERVQNVLSMAGKINFVLLIIALGIMATARYW